VLAAGDRLPEVALWTAPRERLALRELILERPALLLFYIFDWSST
jgi:hypothetical protein